MDGKSVILVVLTLASIATLHVSALTCYSCSNTAKLGTTGYCNISSVANAGTTPCSTGCYTNASVTYEGQVTRGCATAGLANGCWYNSTANAVTCTSVCTSDNCNEALKVVSTGCYFCNNPNPSNNYCQSVTSADIKSCPFQSCTTTTTYNSDGSFAYANLGCGIYPTEGSFTYTSSSGQKVNITQCNSSYCNSGSGVSTTTSTSGIQCYSCSNTDVYGANQYCNATVNTDSVGTMTCSSGSCSTATVYAGPDSVIQYISRGCGQSNCLSTGCMTSGTATYCWSTCQSSNCNGNLTTTAKPDSGSCNNAPGINGNVSTFWLLLSLVAMARLG